MPATNIAEPLILTEWALNMSRKKLDLNEAMHFLKKEFPIREVHEVLNRAIEEKADKNLQEANIHIPSAKERDEAVTAAKAELRRRLGPTDTRNLYNWLEPGKTNSIERITAVKIAFGLQMTVEEAEFFLNRCGHDRFYLRDVKDVIYWHGLENKWDYEKANEMVVKFKAFDQPNEEPDINDRVQNNMVTEHIFLEYEKLRGKRLLSTPKQLEDFIIRHRKFFGSFRRRAYERFMELRDDLEKFWNSDLAVDAEIRKEATYDQEIGTVPLVGETKYVPETISNAELCELIVIGIPALRRMQSNRDEFRKKVLKRIYEHVPTRSTMSEIINKTKQNGKIKEKVDRKLLMLVWLWSGEGAPLYEPGKEEEAYQAHIERINDGILREYGMPILDPRSPFDWIILNSLRCAYFLGADKDGDIDDTIIRMKNLIESLKQTEGGEV